MSEITRINGMFVPGKYTRDGSGSSPRGYVPNETISRLASLAPDSYNADTHTVTAVLSTGAQVARWGIAEELEVSIESIDLSRVEQNLVRLLDHHKAYENKSILGAVTNCRIENGQLVGDITFNQTDEGKAAEGMVSRGEVRGISIGYNVSRWDRINEEGKKEVWLAKRWELVEASIVSVPADPGAGIRSALPPNPPKEIEMNREQQIREMGQRAGMSENDIRAAINDKAVTVTAFRRRAFEYIARDGTLSVDDITAAIEDDAVSVEDFRARAATPAAAPAIPLTPSNGQRSAAAGDTPALPENVDDAVNRALDADNARRNDIEDLGRRAGMTDVDIRSAVNDRAVSVEVFRQRAFDSMATRSAETSISPITIIADEGDTRSRAMTEAIVVRMGQQRGVEPESVSDAARGYLDFSLVDMAAEVTGNRGRVSNARQREDVLRRAFQSTSDFPIIFENATNRVLAARYQLASQIYRSIARQRNFVDFRPHTVVRAGDFPTLKNISEAGEIKYGTFGESKEQISVVPYGRAINFTRQMLVNDSLGAIDDVLGSYGDTIAIFEETVFFSMMLSSATKLITDNKVVFHADHNNLAGTGTGITIAAVSAARAALRKQTSMDGQKLNIAPSILLCSPDKETEAEQIVSNIQAAKIADKNVFAGKLTVLSTAELTGNAWYILADPARIANWQYGFLDGYTAPRIRTDNPFGMQGVAMSVEHDFGVGAIDYRAGYKNPGA